MIRVWRGARDVRRPWHEPPYVNNDKLVSRANYYIYVHSCIGTPWKLVFRDRLYKDATTSTVSARLGDYLKCHVRSSMAGVPRFVFPESEALSGSFSTVRLPSLLLLPRLGLYSTQSDCLIAHRTLRMRFIYPDQFIRRPFHLGKLITITSPKVGLGLSCPNKINSWFGCSVSISDFLGPWSPFK